MRCSVGARFKRTGWVLVTSSRMSQNLLILALKHLLGRFDRVGVLEFLEAPNDERLEQLEGDLLGQTALVQFEFRAHDDHRTGGVVHPLAQQVFHGNDLACP